MNKVIIAGRLGQDPEIKGYGADGKSLAKFTVATNDGWGENEKTNWHRVTVFGKAAENCDRFLSKGAFVMIEGRVEYGTYEDADGNTRYTTDIIADRVEFGPKTDGGGGGGATTGAAKPDQFKDDDIPF